MDVGDDLKYKSSGQKWFLSIFYTETSIYSFSFKFLAFIVIVLTSLFLQVLWKPRDVTCL